MRRLSRERRKNEMSLPLPPVQHVGYVVEDIEEGVAWAVRTLGAGPFFVVSHMPFDVCTFNGEPATYDHSSAFGQWGAIKIELTVVHSTAPPELGEVIGGAAPKVGHIGILVDDLAEQSAALEAAGLPVFHTGAAGPVSARWHDGRTRLGHHVELLQRGPEIEGFYGLIRSSSVGWDGSEPIRSGPGGH
jgi:catechol 2,3-dioxygenase-like lactoylglutathione lyase family enzyme